MTALPATRQQADDEIARAERAMYEATGPLDTPWKRIFALARRGAETVGATEATVQLRNTGPTENGHHWGDVWDAGFTQRTWENEHWHVRRCLILPETE